MLSRVVALQMPLPLLVSVSGNTTGPATPRGATWMCAAVPAMSAVTMVAFIWRVAGSTTTMPVAVAAVFTGGTSSVPVRVAEKTLFGTVLLTELT